MKGSKFTRVVRVFPVLRTLIPVSQRNLKQTNKLLSMPLMDVFISDIYI